MAPTGTKGRGWDSIGGRASKVRPTGALAQYSKAYSSPTVLLGDIQAHLLAESHKPSDRRQDIIHPSEMAKNLWCDRQIYYRLSQTPESNPLADKVSFQLANIFEEGHQIHKKWQTWLNDMGRLWGLWYCESCRDSFYATSPKACEYCHSEHLEYAEVPLSDGKEHGITGHADGAIPDLNALIEIKSIGLGTLRMEEPSLLSKHYLKTEEGHKVYDLDGIWKDLNSPFPSHLRQANIYLHLCEIMGLPYTQMIFLYEFKANQSVKEFTIKRSEKIMEPLLDRVKHLEYRLEQGVPPQRPPFTGKDKKICTTCPYFDTCYRERKNARSTESKQGVGSDGAEESASAPEPIPAGSTGRGSATATERPYGVYRPGTDGPVHTTDDLVVMGRRGGFPGRGRRAVRRRGSSEDQGTQ